MSKKKKIERFYLDKFLDLLGNVPDDVQGNESPDFIVILQGISIGIEVTGFHSDSKGANGRSRRAIEEEWLSLQRNIMDKVDEFEELKNTHGVLFFKKLELPSKSKHGRFIDEIIKLSIYMVRSSIEEIKPTKDYPLLNQYLQKVCLKNVGIYITWDWNQDAASVGLTENELINTAKPKILADYKNNQINELWLLIVSGHRLSQAMGINLSYKLKNYQDFNELLRQSNFKKTYIYQYMFDIIYEWPGWTMIKGQNIL